MSEEHGARLDRVETEVQSITRDMGVLKTDMSGLKSDVRGLAGILGRIEQGVSDAQKRFEDDKHAARVNPVAVAAMLVTIISALLGGAWLISGEIARQDERSQTMIHQMDLVQQRQWDHRYSGGSNGSTSEIRSEPR